MEYRELGATGIQVSAIGFGCNDIALGPTGLPAAEVASTISQAIDLGITLFDTANSYTSGDSERLLGQVLRRRRDQVVLCSKAGHAFWAALPFQRWVGPRRFHSRVNFRPRFLEMAVTGSLRRLGTDYLDVFYLHGPPPSALHDDSVFETLDRFKQRGLIRHCGISCAKSAVSGDALAAIARNGVSVVQILTNVREMIDIAAAGAAARARGVALIGRQPLAHGAIFTDPRFQPLLHACPDRSAAQTALLFALNLDGLASVLVGMRRSVHLRDNVTALEAPALSVAELETLRAITRVR